MEVLKRYNYKLPYISNQKANDYLHLLNKRSYSYTLFDVINTYTYDYGLCGRTALMKLTFKL